jgi:hypothetical protein
VDELRALATPSRTRIEPLPDVPTPLSPATGLRGKQLDRPLRARKNLEVVTWDARRQHFELSFEPGSKFPLH